jgi:hypothetical protein
VAGAFVVAGSKPWRIVLDKTSVGLIEPTDRHVRLQVGGRRHDSWISLWRYEPELEKQGRPMCRLLPSRLTPVSQASVRRREEEPGGALNEGTGYRSSGSSSGRIQVTSGAWPGS